MTRPLAGAEGLPPLAPVSRNAEPAGPRRHSLLAPARLPGPDPSPGPVAASAVEGRKDRVSRRRLEQNGDSTRKQDVCRDCEACGRGRKRGRGRGQALGRLRHLAPGCGRGPPRERKGTFRPGPRWEYASARGGEMWGPCLVARDAANPTTAVKAKGRFQGICVCTEYDVWNYKCLGSSF